MSTCSFLTIRIMSLTYVFHQGEGMGYTGPRASSSKYFV